MAATFNIFFAIKGVLNGRVVEFPDNGLYAPSAVTTSADIKLIRDIVVPTATVTELVAIGSAADTASAVAFAFIPTGACRIAWKGASEADNSGIVLQANAPLVIPGYQTLPYDATVATRIDNTAASITSFSCYQSTGSNIKVAVWSIG